MNETMIKEQQKEKVDAFSTQTIIRRWGNSQGIRLSKEILSQMNLKEDDTIGISIYDGKMTIEKVNKPKYLNLAERLEAFYKRPIDEIYVESTQTTGVILCDQAKMLDVGARNAQFKEACPEDLWNEAKELIISFM